jgi:hypothetical protein
VGTDSKDSLKSNLLDPENIFPATKIAEIETAATAGHLCFLFSEKFKKLKIEINGQLNFKTLKSKFLKK